MKYFVQRYFSYRKAHIIVTLVLTMGIFFSLGLHKQRGKGFNKLVIKIYNNLEHENYFVHAWVADTQKRRRNGLSVFDKMNDDEAMLFVFDKSDTYAFWMKDMKFPIDIVWLDENKRVVYIKEHAQPQDYPEMYKPDIEALFVLEFVDGFIEKNNIQIGDSFKWDNL